MAIKGKVAYEAIQFKRGNEKEVLDFIRKNAAGSWCRNDDGSVCFVCAGWTDKAYYGDYIACVSGRVIVIPKSEFNEFYEIVR